MAAIISRFQGVVKFSGTRCCRQRPTGIIPLWLRPSGSDLIRDFVMGKKMDTVGRNINKKSKKLDCGRNSGDSIQQLTISMIQIQTLAPWQGSPEWSFRIFRITSYSEAHAGWMSLSPLTTDKNTSTCYLKHALDFLAWRLISNGRRT